ncbi:MAG: LemA family protein [Spirochaetaceae bacterium]|nr:MAG: LemA family protein [Spirochaetaceae bacterium]
MASKTTTALIAVGVIVLLVIGGIGWYVGQRNSLIALDESVNGAWSEVDNQLQRRSDLIPNLVSTVRGFASQEQQVFSDIANARARLAGAQTVSETAESYQQMESALSRLLVVVEAYPELRSNQNFLRLQDELAGTENRVAVARQRYNNSVQTYNSRIRMFPASMFAGSLGMNAREYFEVDEGARAVPEVNFD